jgi:hypothetical protein
MVEIAGHGYSGSVGSPHREIDAPFSMDLDRMRTEFFI